MWRGTQKQTYTITRNAENGGNDVSQQMDKKE